MAAKEKDQPRGGVIPYYIKDGEIQMMFMKPSNKDFGGTKFQIAKGKLDPGENIEQCSFREAKEELGLFMPNIISKANLGAFGDVTVYIAKIKDPDMFGDTTDETGAVTWWNPGQFQKDGRDWQKPIVKAAVRKIKKLENLNDKSSKVRKNVD